MALPVKHYISIMSVFDGKDVHVKTVRCQTLNEVRLSFLKFVSVVPLVKAFQRQKSWLFFRNHLLLQCIDGDGIRHELYQR